MSDEGEKSCPLCAEEMDLTDQQLKPCKCGYEICVWCWHHIMDMAEKDDSEGRCPACRSPYNKEKIVGMAAKCERLVAEINMERKHKSIKTKAKTSEGRKQLSSVRVIQRNLVYIVGLPLNLADEDLLQRKEYFSLYGKVLKVSISRTAAGAIQQFSNNTCSVYITYSKEDEAVRCIQTVHGFVLEGRPLRACFGTTKYCHAWLRNVPCNNPDCLYLHEIGSQEDSFTKDEIISAYTRSRVQQITGATNNLQRRSGSMLPPPADDFCNTTSSTVKPIVKTPSSNQVSIVRSPPNSSSGRPASLPAAASWGTRSVNCQQPAASLACSDGSLKQKSDAFSNSLSFSSAVASTTQASVLHSDGGRKLLLNEVHSGTLSSQLSCPPPSKDNSDSSKNRMLHITKSLNVEGQSYKSFPGKDWNDDGLDEKFEVCSELSPLGIESGILNYQKNRMVHITKSLSIEEESAPVNDWNDDGVDEKFEEVCSDLSSMSTNNCVTNDHHSKPEFSLSNSQLIKSPEDNGQGSQQYYPEQYREPSSSAIAVEEDLHSFVEQRVNDSEVANPTNFNSNHSRHQSLQFREAYKAVNYNLNMLNVDKKESGVSAVSNGHLENLVSSTNDFILNEGKSKNRDSNTSLNIGEGSIISDILSMDFDPWDDSITSPRDYSKLLGENDDKQQGPSINVSSDSWKMQNSNQSRFSFARQDESVNQLNNAESFFNGIGQVPKNFSFNQNVMEGREYANGFSSSNVEDPNGFGSSNSGLSYNKLPAGSRAQISVPPGFSVPNRAPPPGFSSHERIDTGFDTCGSLLHETSLLRSPYQIPTSTIGSSADIEFIDPAILEVGKGRFPVLNNNPSLDIRSNFPPQLNAFENDTRLQLLMQRSLSPHQNMRFSEIGESFSPLNDTYGIPSRHNMDQSQASLSPFSQLTLQQSSRNVNSLMSNGHWDGWNDVQSGNGLGITELLRNERLGFNKFYTGYEDTKFRMPTSGDIYNRTFGL